MKKAADAMLPLGLIVIVMGGIIGGIFTATEASAVAVVYTLFLAVIWYREITVKELPGIILESAVTTSIVLLMIGCSIAMSKAMAFADIPYSISDALLALSENPIVLLLIINIALLVVGTFMDMTPALLIFTPIFLPVVEDLGMDPVHFGVVMTFNLCIGICTPPVGSALFVGCSVGWGQDRSGHQTDARVLRGPGIAVIGDYLFPGAQPVPAAPPSRVLEP